MCRYVFFFFNDTATTEIYTLSLHDALPICLLVEVGEGLGPVEHVPAEDDLKRTVDGIRRSEFADGLRSEEHTSELQSRQYLVCRLLLEKKKKTPSPVDLLPHTDASARAHGA